LCECRALLYTQCRTCQEFSAIFHAPAVQGRKAARGFSGKFFLAMRGTAWYHCILISRAGIRLRVFARCGEVTMDAEPLIVHVDMDAFFASIEQRDRGLEGKPVIVGADPLEGRGRGVVATCSYEARAFGVHSAQPIGRAWRLCPHGVFLRPDPAKYAAESRCIAGILERFTPDLVFVSIDEAFLDITGSAHLFGGAEATMREIQRTIREERGLSASIGCGPGRMIAKIASDLEKPGGLVRVSRRERDAFLRSIGIGRVPGVGRKMQERLRAAGIRTVGDVARLSPARVRVLLGEAGRWLYEFAAGADTCEVRAEGDVKSVSRETTFPEDVRDMDVIAARMMRLCEDVFFRCWRRGLRPRTVTTRIRFADFRTHTRSTTFPEPIITVLSLYTAAMENFRRCPSRGRAYRLIGVGVSNFTSGGVQASLFRSRTEVERYERLNRAVAEIRRRYGEEGVGSARGLLARGGGDGAVQGTPKGGE